LLDLLLECRKVDLTKSFGIIEVISEWISLGAIAVEKFNLQTIWLPIRQCWGCPKRAANAVSAKRTLAAHLVGVRIGFVVFDV